MDRTKRYTIVAVGLLVLLMCAGLGYSLLKQRGYFKPPSEVQVYGEWVEQDVPAYSADRIVFNHNGVFHQGKRVAIEFHFDGAFIHYDVAGQTYRYHLDDSNRMVRQNSAYYEAIFVRQPEPPLKPDPVHP